MGVLDNLKGGDPFAALWKAVRELQTAANANSTAIGAGGIRVHSGGGITIENDGGLKVTGTAEIIGRLIASGIIDFTGPVTIGGPLVVEDGGSVTIGSIEFLPDGSAQFGTLTISPEGKITTGTAEINPDGSAKFGTLLIDTDGKVTLQNDLVVEGDGKIIAGETTILPSGAVLFGDSLTMHPADEFGPAGISDGFARYSLTPNDSNFYYHHYQGGGYFDGPLYGHGGFRIEDLPTTTEPANLHIDSTGVVKRSTA